MLYFSPKPCAMSSPIWKPNRSFIEQSQLKKYLNWLFVKKGLYFRDYEDLWDWSVTDLEAFWESMYQFFDIQADTPYRSIVEKPAQGMIGTQWFRGATLNYAEHIFRHKTTQRPALVFASERQPYPTEMSWLTLEKQVAAVSAWLRQAGVKPGDCVVAVLPNIPEAVVSFLAANAVGAVWSSCSPDFGTASITERFQQIAPKVLIVADGYIYNGKAIDKTAAMRELRSSLPSVQRVVWVPYLNPDSQLERTTDWHEILTTSAPGPNNGLIFRPVPFGHPIWVLYSSGTTGKPKAITHSVGGCLLEHLKALTLHQDVRPGDRYFWYSTTGWMMWNFALGSLLAGATLVLYDGSPGYPDLNVLWNLASMARVNHFGGGAAYFISCMKAGLKPIDNQLLSSIKTIGSTGSPLPPEGFRWVYESVKNDVWLISLSGGTDVCSGFVGGCPMLPVYEGEIQTRLLGCRVEAFGDDGRPVRGQLGEMVILEPMPSMPIYFWNDQTDGLRPDDPANNAHYRASYFDSYGPNIWRHGDYIQITPNKTVIIYGRSDATLNRDGVRIGTAEIYRAVEGLPDVLDSLVVGIERPGGQYFMPLFVVLREGKTLTDALVSTIKQTLRSQFSPRHVPDAVFQVPEIPYTISGKKMELPVKKILSGDAPADVASPDTMRNPDSLAVFAQWQRA
jgi:acetoacetyl-CoA synthetase